jgi:hypothetical protein
VPPGARRTFQWSVARSRQVSLGGAPAAAADCHATQARRISRWAWPRGLKVVASRRRRERGLSPADVIRKLFRSGQRVYGHGRYSVRRRVAGGAPHCRRRHVVVIAVIGPEWNPRPMRIGASLRPEPEARRGRQAVADPAGRAPERFVEYVEAGCDRVLANLDHRRHGLDEHVLEFGERVGRSAATDRFSSRRNARALAARVFVAAMPPRLIRCLTTTPSGTGLR